MFKKDQNANLTSMMKNLNMKVEDAVKGMDNEEFRE